MEPPPTRRKFIATLGAAGTISIAGCSYIPGGDSSSSNTSTTNSAGTDSPTKVSGDKNTTNNQNNGKSPSLPGTSVDNFEDDVGSRWGIEYGKYTVKKQDAFQGTQSLALEPKNPKKGVSKITKSFYPKALDLSKHDLSIAVKVNKPKTIRVKAEVIAPAESSKLLASRHIPIEQDGWVRFDLGYVKTKGNPVMDKVTQINIQIGALGGPEQDFQVLIDDLRKIPKPSKGKVMFQFDDADITAYEQAFPVLKENGWPGSVAVIPDVVNGEDRMTEKHMREMGKAGWDMMGHAGPILPKMKEQEQRRILQKVKQYLKLKGHEKGARHFVAPRSRVSSTTLDLIDEIYETGFLFGGCPNNAQHPSNPNFISRVQGPSVRDVRRILDVAEQTNQLVVISYHRIEHGENNVPMSEFRKVVDHVKEKDMDVITPSQFIDGKSW